MRKNAKLVDVLFHAFQCAIRDRQSLADAWGRNTPEGRDALKEAETFRALCVRLCGSSKSEFDRIFENARSVTIQELFRNIQNTEINGG